MEVKKMEDLIKTNTCVLFVCVRARALNTLAFLLTEEDEKQE